MVSYLGVKSPSSSDRFLQQLAMLTDADDLSSSVEDRQLPPASVGSVDILYLHDVACIINMIKLIFPF